MPHPVVRLCFTLALALALVACDNSNLSADQASAGETLRRGNGGDPGTLDPSLAEDVHAFAILGDLYEGLLTEGPDGALLGGVAESWSISADGLTFRFELRDDARWSNGDPVTSGDFLRAFQRAAEPQTPAVYAFLLEPIQNFGAVKSGEMDKDRLGVRAIDAGTLEISLSESTPYFLSIVALPITYPQHPARHDVDDFNDVDAFVGNGPYVLVSSGIGDKTVLERNDTYWDVASVAIERVEYLPVTDTNTEFNMYRSGELHITNTVPPSHIAEIRTNTPGELRIAPSLALYYLAFDLTESPLDNLALREALSLAIDRVELSQLIGRGEQPAFGIVPPGVANHAAARYDWKDMTAARREDAARQKLLDAGYTERNPLRIKITYDIGDIHEQIALIVSAMWQDVLDVDVELEKKEWKFFLDSRDDRPSWDVMRFSWFGDYNDALTFLEIFHSASLQNLPRYQDDRFDALLDHARATVDLDERASLMTAAEQTLLDSFPIAPLYFYVSKHLVRERLLGFEDNVLDRHPSKYLSFSAATE